MSGYIDRNPQQMMKYAQDARAVISDMALIVRKVEGRVTLVVVRF